MPRRAKRRSESGSKIGAWGSGTRRGKIASGVGGSAVLAKALRKSLYGSAIERSGLAAAASSRNPSRGLREAVGYPLAVARHEGAVVDEAAAAFAGGTTLNQTGWPRVRRR